MEKEPESNYGYWLEQVRDHELARAQSRLSNKLTPEQAVEELSKRIMDKAIHPLIKLLKLEQDEQLKNKSSVDK
jgi:glutamyl-tRNA reductase